MSAGFTITGGKELAALLKKLPDRVFNNVVRKANQDIMRPALKTAKQLAAKDTGVLRQSIGIKTKVYKKRGVVFTAIGPRVEFSKKVKHGGGKSGVRWPVKYAHLVENGHRIARKGTVLNRRGQTLAQAKAWARKGKKTLGLSMGIVRPHPFMRPAFNQHKHSMVGRYTLALRTGIMREAKKAGGK